MGLRLRGESERRKGGKRKYGRKRGKGKRKRWTKGTCTSALTHILTPPTPLYMAVYFSSNETDE